MGQIFSIEGECMPRISRQISSTKVYHIILRGIDKQDIFLSEKDYNKFLEILKETKKQYEFDIYSYCLMNNHVHMVIYDKKDTLQKIMKSVGIKYSIYFNRKYGRVGHLFQDRYLSKKIEDREYLRTVCRYIHQNPQKAGIERTEEYKWSSYNEYIGKRKIINPKMLLLLFDEKEDEAINEFINFHRIQSNTEISDLIEYEMREKMTDDEAIKYICETVKTENIHEILELNVEKRKQIISKIKENKKITSAQIARVLGLNRKMIERIK